MTERTFSIIKPNAVAAGAVGQILDAMLADGFRIIGLKLVCMSRNEAEKFYAVHRGKPFYDRLVTFMTSGPSVVLVLEREDAVAGLRRLAGATDPAKAAEGTLRRRFGENVTRNAVHASDSVENAREEAGVFSTNAKSSWPAMRLRPSRRRTERAEERRGSPGGGQ